ncbi:hypothetical protein [Sphingomonas sp.]|uniref:hypothetical protein n=1 Tax=Sphingomonas sp. TaxID=28214 RepID=UPI0035C7B780
MLKVKDITLATERYGDAYEGVVTFQVGDQNYNTVKVTLPPAATREIVDLALRGAIEVVATADTTVRVAGEPLPLRAADPIDPKFAEVEEFAFTPFKPEEHF